MEGLVHTVRHVIGCHMTRKTMVQSACPGSMTWRAVCGRPLVTAAQKAAGREEAEAEAAEVAKALEAKHKEEVDKLERRLKEEAAALETQRVEAARSADQAMADAAGAARTAKKLADREAGTYTRPLSSST